MTSWVPKNNANSICFPTERKSMTSCFLCPNHVSVSIVHTNKIEKNCDEMLGGHFYMAINIIGPAP